ncbi:HD domain-containing protein [Paenibacillus sp. HJGM_3]|uniref:HD domain-containing protein n=1 Tax=Paenibacillus sp. HJGM_3 TaxID=3379816 RepID=UPI00385DF368
MELNIDMERFKQQLAFIVEIDKLKSVYRRAFLTDRSRNENDAEHSWHLATMALIFQEYANESAVDLLRVVKMLLVHDLVEIDAGDFSPYDTASRELKMSSEQEAARRIFGLLPEEQGRELLELWLEFEARTTPESKFAGALDRLAPLLQNYYTEGKTWKQHGIKLDMVLKRNAQIGEGSEGLWQFAQQLVRDAAAKGYLPVD